MPDAGEVKAKVVIEYDGGGFQDAEDALKSLGEEGGAFTRNAGSAVESAFAGLEKQALSTASAFDASTEALMNSSGPFAQWASDTKTFTDAIYGAGAFTDQWGQSVSDLAGSVSDASGAFQDFNKNLDEAHQFMGGAASSLTDSVTLYNDLAASVEHTSGKMSAFSDIMNTDLAPGIGGFLGEFNRGFMELGQIAWLAPMIGQAFQGAGSAIYSNAVAAGPAAAPFVQQMNIAAADSAKQGAAFAVSFGQAVIPFLTQYNAAQQQGGTGLQSWLGGALGNALVGNPFAAASQLFGLAPSQLNYLTPVPGPYIQNNAWVPGAAQLGGNWSAVAGQYPAGSYLQGPPGWVPNPPGLGPQPGPGAGPSTLRVEASHAEIQTGNFTFAQPGGGGSIPLFSGIGDMLGGIGNWLGQHLGPQPGFQENQVQTQGLGITQIPKIDWNQQITGAFSQLTSMPLPKIDWSGMLSQVFTGLTGAQPPHIDWSGLLSGVFSGLTSGLHLPNIDWGQLLSGVFSGLTSGLHLPHIDWGQLLSDIWTGLTHITPPHIDWGGILDSIWQGLTNIQLPHIDWGGIWSSIWSGLTNIQLPHIDWGSIISGVFQDLQNAISHIHINIPFFAGGVENFGGGLAVVGDRGPELLKLPAGSSVYPMSTGAGVSASSLAGIGGGGGPQTINFTFQLDSQTLVSTMGIPLASAIRLSNGYRGA